MFGYSKYCLDIFTFRGSIKRRSQFRPVYTICSARHFGLYSCGIRQSRIDDLTSAKFFWKILFIRTAGFISKCFRKDRSLFPNKHSTLCEKFADGLRDSLLRKEATAQWTYILPQVPTNSPTLEQLLKIIEAQQKQIYSLTGWIRDRETSIQRKAGIFIVHLLCAINAVHMQRNCRSKPSETTVGSSENKSHLLKRCGFTGLYIFASYYRSVFSE